MPQLDQDDLERFYAKVDDSGNCHEWQSHIGPNGYGHFSLGGKKRRSHRVAYRIENDLRRDELPEVVRHSCDNPSCVNPDHLEGGTQEDNIRDRQVRGRQAKGEENGRAKLDEDAVFYAREEDKSGRSFRSIARELGVDWTTIRAAVRGETWSHVPMPG